MTHYTLNVTRDTWHVTYNSWHLKIYISLFISTCYCHFLSVSVCFCRFGDFCLVLVLLCTTRQDIQCFPYGEFVIWLYNLYYSVIDHQLYYRSKYVRVSFKLLFTRYFFSSWTYFTMQSPNWSILCFVKGPRAITGESIFLVEYKLSSITLVGYWILKSQKKIL